MSSPRLREHRTCRNGEPRRHRDNFQVVRERLGDCFDDLADGEHPRVATVVNLTRRHLGPVDSHQNSVSNIFHIPSVIKGQTVVWHYDATAAIQNSPDDTPFAWTYLIWTVEVRIAEVRSVRMNIENRPLCLRDAPALRVFCLNRHELRILMSRYRHPARLQNSGIHVAAVCGRASDRNEAAGSAKHCTCNPAQSSVCGERQIKAAVAERLLQRVFGERVGVNVFDFGRYLIQFMLPRMKHRHMVSSPNQSVDD